MSDSSDASASLTCPAAYAFQSKPDTLASSTLGAASTACRNCCANTVRPSFRAALAQSVLIGKPASFPLTRTLGRETFHDCDGRESSYQFRASKGGNPSGPLLLTLRGGFDLQFLPTLLSRTLQFRGLSREVNSSWPPLG